MTDSDEIFGLDADVGIKHTDEEKDIRDYMRRARKAFDEYWYERRGRPYKPSERAEKPDTWRRIAMSCLRCGALPEHFIKANTLYAQSLLLPSMLVGKKAEGHWRTWNNTHAYLQAEDQPQAIDKGGKITTGIAILNKAIDNCKQELQYRVGTSDIFAPGIIDNVCENQYDYEAIGLMLVSEGDPKVAFTVRSRCYEWLHERPAVVKAMKDEGVYDTILQLINETDPAHPL